ncbi:hypothetical protein RJ640_005768 [Escallonia rubra]|uniref:Retrotransposon gag domain-containing protein n=1 Tax=Escallonia rubra TaxID=112253 RepID=A0AA88RSB2_9ASTE|nr:hypothetical protein RJ640_005768 [Escallonia rubra]
MTSRMMTEEERIDLTWQGFKDLFFTKYFPPNMKEAMESDFMRITQHPSESVLEYQERFARLSRRQMSIMDNPTYAQVVDGAQRLERIYEEQKHIWEDKKKKRKYDEFNSGKERTPSDAKRRSTGGSGQKQHI